MAQLDVFHALDQGLAALEKTDRDAVSAYAGQQVLTGAQAKVFADNYIAAHLKNREPGNAPVAERSGLAAEAE